MQMRTSTRRRVGKNKQNSSVNDRTLKGKDQPFSTSYFSDSDYLPQTLKGHLECKQTREF